MSPVFRGPFQFALLAVCLLISPAIAQQSDVWIIAGGPPALIETSPADGDQSVAVTRETILRFDQPIDPETVSLLSVSATFGDQPLAAARHLSPDGKALTLFYDELLPASSRIFITIDGDLLRNIGDRPILFPGQSEPGGIYTFQFDTLSLTPVAGTSIAGRVFASELVTSSRGDSLNRPLAGVRITVDGAEDTIFTTTDNLGNFRLENCPAGKFFVHVDGRTATTDPDGQPTSFPDGPYYPFVGKAWTSVAGEEANVGDVFLPLVEAGTLKPVSETEDTDITFTQSVLDEFPGFEDVVLTVPADSLYADDGSRGGMVGIAPVPPDRLPGTLPPGLVFPIVITVQTNGPTNFDVPAPICFPNLPNPTTNEVLLPDQKSALLSFNHDSGAWEHVGGMTVSQDGTLVCSDPGVGIRAPGWHGVQDSSPPSTKKPRQKTGDGSSGCLGSLLWGTLDCGLSFLPFGAFANCALGLAVGFGQTLRDCKGVSTRRDKAGCGITVGSAVGGEIATCFLSGIPGLGSVIACGGAALGALNSCTKIRVALDPQQQAQLNDLIAKAEAHIIYAEALRDWAIVLYGSEVWTSLDLEDADPGIGFSRTNEILENIRLYALASSDQAEDISPTEAANLLALPRPPHIAESDVQDLIDYINTTLMLWDAGLTTHVAAGRTDFMGEDEFDDAIDAIGFATEELIAAGVLTYDIHKAFRDINEFLYNNYDHETEEVVYESVYFKLHDKQTGFVQRGKLTSGGALQVVTLPSRRSMSTSYYYPDTNSYQKLSFQSNAANQTTELPGPLLYPLDGETDSDNDQLPDRAEDVIGTNPGVADTDEDGIDDGPEVFQGLDPLDNRLVRVGIIAAIDTPGQALDVHTTNNLAIVADGSAGVTVFNIFDGMDPRIITGVDTPGAASRVSASSNSLVAVADGAAGISVIDISDPPFPQLLHQISIGNVENIATSLNQAYTGSEGGSLFQVDIAAGSIANSVDLVDPVTEVAIEGDTLYATSESATGARLHAFSIAGDDMVFLGSVPLNEYAFTTQRIWAGGETVNIAYTKFNAANFGYLRFDTSDPNAIQEIGRRSTFERGWRQLVSNGSGLGLGVSGATVNVRDMWIMSLSDDSFVAQVDTPGIANALSINNGLVYLADDTEGLQVINYLAYDNQDVPPTITLSGEILAAPLEIVEGTQFLVTAQAEDDVQIRNVEFAIDGERKHADGNFPFEFRFRAPFISDQSSFTLRARARDTGGNVTVSDSYEITLLPDNVGPHVVRTYPRFGKRNVDRVIATFSEPLDLATLTPASFFVEALTLPGGLPASQISYDQRSRSAILTFAETLPDDIYQINLTSSITDGLSNTLVPYQSTFIVEDAIFWVAGNGRWQAPGNWNEGRLPLADEHAIIDVPSVVTVSKLAEAHEVGSLRSDENLTLVDGTLQVNGEMEVTGDFTLDGGELKNAIVRPRSSPLTTTPNDGTLSGVTLRNDFNIADPATVIDVYNGITIDGTTSIFGGSFTTNSGFRMQGSADLPLNGIGEIIFSTGGELNGPRSYITQVNNGGRIVIGPDLTVRGRAGYIGRSDLPLQNNGTIHSDQFGEITVSGDGMVNDGLIEASNTGEIHISGTWTNNGQLVAETDSPMTLDGDWQNLGTIDVTNTVLMLDGEFELSDIGTLNHINSTMRIVGDMTNPGTFLLEETSGNWELGSGGQIIGGRIETSGTAVLTVNPGVGKLNGVTLAGRIDLPTNNALWPLNDLTFDNGQIVMMGLENTLVANIYIPGPAASFLGNGEIIFSTPSRNNIGASGGISSDLLFGPGITIRGGGGSISAGFEILRNQGHIDSNEAGDIFLSGGSIVNEGIISTSNGGEITINAPLTNTGVLFPGVASPMDGSTDITLVAAGTLRIPLEGVGDDSHGQLTPNGTVSVSGTLELVLQNDFIPLLGNSFTIIEATSVTGTFDPVTSDPGNGNIYEVTYNPTTVVVTVSAP